MNRREMFARLTGLVALGAIGNKLSVAAAAPVEELVVEGPVIQSATKDRARSFSLAHITDVHLTPEKNAEAWFAQCLHAIQSHKSSPSLILNTGDSVMDSLQQDRAHTDKLWSLWRGVLQRELSLPIHQTLGNHDHWGLALPDDKAVKSDLMYGKKRGLDGFGIERGYHSFDYNDWHLIALDSCLPTGTPDHGGWTGQLDEAQFEWLKFDLATTPADKNVLVYCHIPILEVASMIHKPATQLGTYRWGPSGMQSDARQIIDLFAQYPNVKLCLSGHLHLHDRVDLGGVTYINAGAVCGAWWNGYNRGTVPGYSVVTLHADGTFDYKYETYGWKKADA